MSHRRSNKIVFANDLYIVFSVDTPSYPDTVTIIDTEEWDKVSKYKWGVHRESDFLYVRSSNREAVRLHRLIMSAPDNMHVDHIDCNTLINVKSNLRVCTSQQHSSRQRRFTNTIRGIRFKSGKWEVSIETKEKAYYLGRYDNLGDAMKAYNSAAKLMFGDFAVLHNVEEVLK